MISKEFPLMAPPEPRYLLASVRRAVRPGIRQQLPRIDDVTADDAEATQKDLFH